MIMNRNRWMKLVAVALLVCATSVFAAENAAATVRGNPDSKVYHKEACRHYAAKGSSREFKTEAAAKKAGYKPCKKCAAPDADNASSKSG
jgi:methylphosphotriester-DNA--protein-cysteine methyltransferase